MSGIVPFSGTFCDYLHDESRLVGRADSVSTPDTAEEAAEQLRELVRGKTRITIQGARTGICGAAVPQDGHVMSMARLNRITALRQSAEGGFVLFVQPGLSLADINSHLRLRSFDTADWDEESLRCLELLRKAPPQRFAPNPTEDTASIGGAFACNARGLNELSFGSVGANVEVLTVLLPDGREWRIERGEYVYDGESWPLPGGERLSVKATDAAECFPALSSRKGMDLIDLFAGSEGMLGTVLELGLRLRPAAREQWGMCFFLPKLDAAARFGLGVLNAPTEGVCLAALELMDSATLTHVRESAATIERLRRLPALPERSVAAVYIELEGEEEDAMAEAVMQISALFEECGGLDEDTWFYEGEDEVAKLRVFRHAAPESVNMAVDRARLTDESITKLCLDMTLPVERLGDMLRRYEEDIACAGYDGTVFGHFGSGRLHVNIIPRDSAEKERAKLLLRTWAEAAAGYGALLAGENGIGKQKKYLLSLCSAQRLEAAHTIKNYFDPEGLLNPGNLFPEEL